MIRKVFSILVGEILNVWGFVFCKGFEFVGKKLIFFFVFDIMYFLRDLLRDW